MSLPSTSNAVPALTLRPVSKENWRAVAQLTVAPQQTAFVATPCYYLALCCYDDIWHPLAIILGDAVIGFCMWGIDPADQSCWIGGLLIDQHYQGRGHGKGALQAALMMLSEQYDHQVFALSYQPNNLTAKKLYASLGFRETGEWEDDEVVARLRYVP
jgi:diamine N-acetyltransferase